MTSKVTTRGQVSIPAEIRKRFHIEPEIKDRVVYRWQRDKNYPLPKDTGGRIQRAGPEEIQR